MTKNNSTKRRMGLGLAGMLCAFTLAILTLTPVLSGQITNEFLRVDDGKTYIVRVVGGSEMLQELTPDLLLPISWIDDRNHRTVLSLPQANAEPITGTVTHEIYQKDPIPRGTIIHFDGIDLSEPDGLLLHYFCPPVPGITGLESRRLKGSVPRFNIAANKFGATQIKATSTPDGMTDLTGSFQKLPQNQQSCSCVIKGADGRLQMGRRVILPCKTWDDTTIEITYEYIIPTGHFLTLRDGVTLVPSTTHRAQSAGTYLINGTTWTYMNRDFSLDPNSTLQVSGTLPPEGDYWKDVEFNRTTPLKQICDDIRLSTSYLTVVKLRPLPLYSAADKAEFGRLILRLNSFRILKIDVVGGTGIPENIGSLTNVRELGFSWLGLTDSPQLRTLGTLTGLRALDISNNLGMLTEPTLDILRGLTNLTYLKLNGLARVIPERVNELPYIGRLTHYWEPNYIISNSAALSSGGRMQETHGSANTPQENFTISFWYRCVPGDHHNHWFSLGSTTSATNVTGHGNYFDLFSRPVQGGGNHELVINTPKLKTDTAHRPKTVTWTEAEVQKPSKKLSKAERHAAKKGKGEWTYHKTHPHKHCTLKWYDKIVQVPKSRVDQEPYTVYSLEAWKNNIASAPFQQTGWQHVVIQGVNAGKYQVFLNGQKVVEVDNIYGPGLSAAGRMHFGSETSSHLCNVQGVHGQILPPSAFGRTNRERKWVPVLYEGPFGPNGFNLLFADAANLGKDTSGNNRIFTPPPGMSHSASTPTS